MYFKILSKIESIRTIAVSSSIKNLSRLNKQYGKGRWRKMKGIATVELDNMKIVRAEIHWYEANGLGKFEYKIKRII